MDEQTPQADATTFAELERFRSAVGNATTAMIPTSGSVVALVSAVAPIRTPAINRRRERGRSETSTMNVKSDAAIAAISGIAIRLSNTKSA